MLRYGLQENAERADPLAINFVAMDGLSLACRDASIDVALIFCSIHCIQDKARLFTELKRVVRPDGFAIVLTFDPQNLHRTLYHRLFPGYLERDLTRYIGLDQLDAFAARHGFIREQTMGIPYRIEYNSVDEFIELVKEKPFSTFSYYSAEAFAANLIEFKRKLVEEFNSGKVVNGGEMTLLVFRNHTRGRRGV
jgi:ubiquinone/menaquinone biosynthesis C-methylase UbiE